MALLWRRLMFRTTFIAVTGSVGKSTATECLKRALAAVFAVNGTEHGRNGGRELAAIVRRTRWHHRFTVIEVGANLPGALKRAAWMIAPDVTVVLSVAGVHTNSFPSLEHIAAEKAQLLSRLGRLGMAVLNGDDPLVAAMAARCRSKVVTFGRSPGLDFRAGEISSVWPARLSFRIHHGAESRIVNTRLVGEHWLSAVLGALAAAVSNGVALASAVAAVEQIDPLPARMEPLPLPGGACMLRDDRGGTFASLPAALAVLTQVPGRRVLVYGDVRDAGLTTSPRFQKIGQMAAGCADLILVYNHQHRRVRNAMIAGGVAPDRILSFPEWGAVADYLKSSLRPEDVVLLRGRHGHSATRIYFSQLGSVGCTRPQCSRRCLCDECAELRPGLEHAGALPPPLRPYWFAAEIPEEEDLTR